MRRIALVLRVRALFAARLEFAGTLAAFTGRAATLAAFARVYALTPHDAAASAAAPCARGETGGPAEVRCRSPR